MVKKIVILSVILLFCFSSNIFAVTFEYQDIDYDTYFEKIYKDNCENWVKDVVFFRDYSITDENKDCNLRPLYYPRCSLKELLKENKFDYIFVAGNEHFANTEHNGNKYPIIHTITIKKGSYNIFKSDGFYIFDRKNKKKDGFPSETAFMNNFLQTYYIPEFTKDLLTGERDLTVLSRGETGSGGGSLSRLYFKFTNNYAESKIGSRDLDELFSKVKAKKNNFYVLATNIPELMDLQDKDIQKYVPVKPIPIKPIPSGGNGDGDGNSDGGGKNNDLTKINEKIAKLDNLDKLSFLEQIYKKCCEIKDKISNLDILKDILDYLKKILYENQKTNDYLSTLLKSINYENTDNKDNKDNKELIRFLERFKESLLESMSTLDRDDDEPLLFSIREVNQEILNVLHKLCPEDISSVLYDIRDTLHSIHAKISESTSATNQILKVVDSLRPIVSITNGSGSGSGDIALKVIAKGGDFEAILSKLDAILNALENLAGSKEQAQLDLDALKDALQRFVNQDPFGSARHLQDQMKNFDVEKGPKFKSPKVSIGGMEYDLLNLEGCQDFIPIIREMLVATLYISLFVYLVRAFIPRLKI